MNANWLTGYEIAAYWWWHEPVRLDVLLCEMQPGSICNITYSDLAMAAAIPVVFSEARRSYSGGTSFTGGGVISPVLRALRIDYRGSGD